MGKRQAKKAAGWSRLTVGVTISMVTYLLGICLISFLMVKGILLPEKSGAVLAVWVTVAAACGSLPVIRMKVGTPLLTCFFQGGIFVAVILAASYLFWEGTVWSKANIVLLLCAVAGALLPGALCGGGGKGRKKHRW